MLTKRSLDAQDARALLAAAARRAEEIGVPMCMAVTDAAGVKLIAFERMDSGKVSSVAIAIDKAFTAAAARRDGLLGDADDPNSPAWRIHGTNGGRFSTIGGSIPLVVDEKVVGGIGVSSGSQAPGHRRRQRRR